MFICCYKHDELSQIGKIIIFICDDIFLRISTKIEMFNFKYSNQKSKKSLGNPSFFNFHFRFYIKKEVLNKTDTISSSFYIQKAQLQIYI